MISTSRIDSGSQIISAGVRKTIQSIKEIVGNHSDIDIYWALKETNMDPNETAQKLLNQDPFHEVKRRKDKRKENAGLPGNDNSADPPKHSETVVQGMKSNKFSDRNVHRGGYSRNALPRNSGPSRKFRVVRDNRANQTMDRDVKPASPQHATSATERVNFKVSGNGSTGGSSTQKPSDGKNSSQTLNGPIDSQHKFVQDNESSRLVRKEVFEEKRVAFSNAVSQVPARKAQHSESHSSVVASSSSAVGVYSSSTDPVHVPSPDSRPSASVGAIKREVGVVGVRRQSSENSKSSLPNGSVSNSVLGGERPTESVRSFATIAKNDQLSRGDRTTESVRSFTTAAKNDQLSQTSESVIPSITRSILFSQSTNRPHQQPMGHHKASHPNKEWKPKSSQKPNLNGPGVIGTPTKSISPHALESEDVESEAAKMQDNISRLNLHENQNVIIAQHIRVPETDRCRLTFGSFGKELDSSRDLGNGFQVGATGESNGEPAASLSVSAPEPTTDDASSSNQVDLIDEQIRNSGSDSPPSGAASEQQLQDKKDSSSPQDLDNYSDIGLVRDSSPSYARSESQQQDPSELPGFSAYDAQSGYDFPYFRPTIDEAMRGQGLPSPHEALSSHNANGVPSSTIAMVQQQQQPPVAQMYPQVHVSHFANLMPYRQFLSPVYVPPMAMPGYSSSAAYPHPSNGNSYLLMPGGSTHLNANSLKYGVQQFKPVPTGSQTGFGNFANPNGYAMNAPGVVGGASGLEDSSRMKYNDGNIYVTNPQAETSEMWIPNPRELPGMQSTPYYNMPGQSPHAAYLPSHTGHASFNAAAAQSSHMQFQGMYHPPPQPGAIANPHHLGPAMGGNVGVAAASPGAQVGAYQQPQLGHLNWTTNF
ncbi:hypothetical protein UlMin_011972 [Ulmus minor]